MKYKLTDLAWAAGFLDGEGTLNINFINRKDRCASFPIYLGATQVREKPLLKLQKMFGGTVHYYEYSSSFHVWRLQGAKRLSVVLPLLIPYFIVKRKEAQLGLRFCEHVLANGSVGRNGLSEREIEVRYLFVDAMKALR